MAIFISFSLGVPWRWRTATGALPLGASAAASSVTLTTRHGQGGVLQVAIPVRCEYGFDVTREVRDDSYPAGGQRPREWP